MSVTKNWNRWSKRVTERPKQKPRLRDDTNYILLSFQNSGAIWIKEEMLPNSLS